MLDYLLDFVLEQELDLLLVELVKLLELRLVIKLDSMRIVQYIVNFEYHSL